MLTWHTSCPYSLELQTYLAPQGLFIKHASTGQQDRTQVAQKVKKKKSQGISERKVIKTVRDKRDVKFS